MKAADLLAEIAQAGGTITAIGDKLKFQRVPARLVPVIKQNKTELLAELQSMNMMNFMNIDSRYLAPPRIVHDSEPKFSDPELAQDLSPQDTKTINDWLTHIGETDTALIATLFKCCKADHVVLETTLKLAAENPPKVWTRDYKGQSPDEWKVVAPLSAPAPAAVTCGQCSQFQPGSPSISIGVCLVTSHGLPPKGGKGYKATFSMAPRQCPNFIQEKN